MLCYKTNASKTTSKSALLITVIWLLVTHRTYITSYKYNVRIV